MISALVTHNPFLVYTRANVTLEVSSTTPLNEGNRIDVRFPNSWTVGNDPSFTKQLQTDDPNGADYISAEVAALDCEISIRIYGADYFTGGPSWRHGRNIELTLKKGQIPPNTPIILHFNNTLSSRIAETEEIYVALNGDLIESLPEIVTLPREHYMMRIIVPSSARPGEEFTVRIISLDPFFNLSSTHHQNVRLLDDTDRVIEESIDFTGSTTLQTSIDEEGVYRFRVGETIGNPIKISREFTGPYWGDIHIHSRLSHDGIDRYPYQYAR